MYQFCFVPLTLYVKYVLNIMVGPLRVHFFLPTYVHIFINIEWIFAEVTLNDFKKIRKLRPNATCQQA